MQFHSRCKLCNLSKMLPTVNELLTKMYEDEWSYRQIKRKLEDFGIIVSHIVVHKTTFSSFTT